MIPLSLAQVAEAVGGELADASPREAGAVVRAVGLDSRAVGPGGLFVALRGECVDGHDYARQAMAAGAVGILADRPVGVPAVVVPRAVGPGANGGVPAGLGRLAAAVLSRLADLTVVGVTGSSGKTTTKDLLAALLARLGPTVAAVGSYNNELGLPLTVLRCDEGTRYLVLEYGARGLGHLTTLAAVARPRVAVVLNVGSAHLGEFGSREVTAAAKSELVAAVRPGGGPGPGPAAVLNADDPLVAAMRSVAAVPVRTFGESPAADVRAEAVLVDEAGRAGFTLVEDGRTSARVQLRLVGEHLVSDALAAAAVARHLGLPAGEVAEVLAAAGPASPHRMAVTTRPDGVTVVDDSYNANPESMRAALKALAAMSRSPGRRGIAVLGEMLELGERAPEEHDALGRLAVRLDVGRVVSVGDPSGPVGRLHAGATLEGSWGEEAVHVADPDKALAYLRAELRPGDVVLVKASRSVGLERVAEALLADCPTAVAG